MTNFTRFSLFLILAILGAIDLHAAGLRIGSDITTQVKIFLTTGITKILNINPTSWDLTSTYNAPGIVTYDAFFEDGPSVGIDSIEWRDSAGTWWRTPINLKWIDGFRWVRILKSNQIIDPGKIIDNTLPQTKAD